MKCDNCDKEVEITYKSVGGLEFCHACAHDLGLLHRHPDNDNTFHGVGMKKRELKKHLEAYLEVKG